MYVTATNSVGQGKQSATTTGEPNAVPDQVTGLATDVGDGQVTLTWQPAQVDGTPVTGYDVEISPPPGGQQQIQPVGVTTSHAFTGLVNGTTYTFNVMAVNAAGQRAVVPRGHRGTVRQAADDGRADRDRRARA